MQRQEQLSVDSQSFFYLIRVLRTSALDPELDPAPPETGITNEVFRLKTCEEKNLYVFHEFESFLAIQWQSSVSLEITCRGFGIVWSLKKLINPRRVKQAMDYTNMSAYYDVIMTSGYYDYPGIVDSLLSHPPIQNVIEIGCGTGLILEEIAKREPSMRLRGIDLTQAMLDIATHRLQSYPNIELSQQNVVDFDLQEQFDVAYSYGGVWYFVIDGEQEPFMVSHIADHDMNVKGLQHLSRHLKHQGQLLLGIQGPHFDYEKTISNGMTYAQEIVHTDIGFIKHYALKDGPRDVMALTVNYRTYSFQEAQEMLGVHGIEYVSKDVGGKFLRFQKS